MRLRTVSPRTPGWTRRRVGRSFTYLDTGGERLPAEDVERIKALVIPPAWTDVWICPFPNGHIQAIGTDAAGRRQYLYHQQWRIKRDAAKFDRIVAAAEHLPRARRHITRDLELTGMPLERACAAAVRLLDLGYFRIGSDVYAEANGSFGLTTLERGHVRRAGQSVVFSFTGKSGIAHRISIDDGSVLAALETMRKRRGVSRRLLAYQVDGRWRDLDAGSVNAYLADLFDGQMTAKDFRTWHACVIAAESLATTEEPGGSAASRRRAVRGAVVEVASYLGNTPTVARSSYIDPRIIALYEAGRTISLEHQRRRSPSARQAALERSVLDLLS